MCRHVFLLCCAMSVAGAAENSWGHPAARGEAGVAPRAALDRDPHLVAWWKFDAQRSGVAADASKGGHDGLLRGGLASSDRLVKGVLGSALRFDAGKDVVEITDYKGVEAAAARTVVAWIKTTNARGEILAWGADDFGKMWTFGFIRGHVGVTPSGGYLYIKDQINDGRWHHVAAVLKEAEEPGLKDVALYVDGLPATIDDIGLLDLWPIGTGKEMDVRIGRRFKGLMDDVRIYARALADEEIKSLFERVRNTTR
jgi:hypothetical protein